MIRPGVAALAALALVLGSVPRPVLAQDAGAIPAFQPASADERGLWMEMDEAERLLKTSRFVVREPELNAYVRGVLCREVGEARCQAARIYIVRTPYFNASMAPNGMMQVWTGLLVRMHDEAQLAAVLGHEFAHFEKRHSLQNFRSIRGKTDALAWLSFLPLAGTLASIGILGSIFSFNRDMEREADITSLSYMRSGGYTPRAASAVWLQVVNEGNATAAARGQKKRRHNGGGFFDSHPASDERLAYLANLARDVPEGEAGGYSGAAEYRRALAGWWAPLIDDQIKLNDFGGTEYLLGEMASEGWTPELLYARGELYRARGAPGDMEAAAGFYRQADAAGYVLPELRRGLGLALLRTGQTQEGRALLRKYVETRPDAADRPMMTMLAGG